MDACIRIGKTILATIIKIASKNDMAEIIVDGVNELVDATGEDYFAQREVERKKQEIIDNISKSCYKVLDHYQVEKNRISIICQVVVETVKETIITYEDVFVKRITVDRVAQLFLDNISVNREDYNETEWELLNRLFRHSAGIIINCTIESPQFVNHGIQYLFDKFLDLDEKLNEILLTLHEIDEVTSKKTEDFQKYERIYRNNIQHKYEWIQLFGVKNLSRDEKRYKLSIAYVSLEMKNAYHSNNIVSIENLFTESNRLWIEGDAGSGKTTLLQWLAVNSASNNYSIVKELQDSIPFVVELRKQDTKKLSIKNAINTIMHDSDVNMPGNWLSHNLDSGKAIILVDGFDEVKAEDRDEVQNWIDDLMEKYPKTRIVVTSRPEMGRVVNKSFRKLRLLPMSREKMAVFLDYWHQAVLIDKLGVNKIEAEQYRNKLVLRVDNSDSIRKMMTNPLLCAMVCALHYKNGAIMSNERNELYEDCCKMLFGNRDLEREINAFVHIALTYEEKKSILAQVAYWLMKNNLVIASEEQIISCIERSLRMMRRTSQVSSAEELFQYFMERSGILRMPEEGKVDFIHKSFQEYLAAYEIHNQDDWGFITGKAYDINWYETLILAMGFASMPNAKFVIETILGEGDNSRDIVIAAACASNTNRLDFELRNKLNQKIEGILPPKTQDESESIARAEEFVVPYLSNKEGMSGDEQYFSLNALRIIGTVQALSVAGTFLHGNIETRSLHLLDDMLRMYTSYEIKQSGFLEILASYIVNVSKETKICIGETTLMHVEQCNMGDITKLFSVCEELIIFGYGDRISKEIIKTFKNVKRLALIGSFSNISAIKKISNQLITLSLNDSSGMFNFYCLNSYSFLKLEQFYYQSTENIYFNGDDCHSISHVKELGIFLYNSNSDLTFDGFERFQNLNTIWLYHDALLDLRIEELLEKNRDLKEVFLIFPDYTDMRFMLEMRRELQMYKNIVIKTKYYSTCFKDRNEYFLDKDTILKPVIIK